MEEVKFETQKNKDKSVENPDYTGIDDSEEKKPNQPEVDQSKAEKKTYKKNKKIKKDELAELEDKLQEMNDKYLRLSAEFDNYRKRTLKEKIELSKTASEDILINLLPVMDDFERAMQSINKTEDINTVKHGTQLIYNKFKEFLLLKGIKEIEALNKKFDTDVHEALTKMPAPKKKLKGKIIDVIEKGYFLHDKVIRFSKVVVGE